MKILSDTPTLLYLQLQAGLIQKSFQPHSWAEVYNDYLLEFGPKKPFPN